MKLKSFLWLLVLASLWGPSFLFVKVAVVEIPPGDRGYGHAEIISADDKKE